MLKKIQKELNEWIVHLLRWLPGFIGLKLRYFYYRRKLAGCGVSVNIQIGCFLGKLGNICIGNNIGFGLYSQILANGDGTEKIIMGDNVFLNSNVMINADSGGFIEIGSYCIIGPNVVFRTSDHVFSDVNLPIVEQGHKSGKIIVEDNVWIGANVVLTGDVVIGNGAVIGAGAVVTKNVPSYTIVAGIPAKVIGTRTKKEGHP